MSKVVRRKLLTPMQVARILGVSERSVIRYCGQGLSHYRIGKLYRFELSDVQEFSKNHRKV